MANLKQAPAIKYQGEKMKDTKGWGKAIRTHELEAAIMNGLGERDMAMLKIMLFLTGNAEGFQVAEKTIMERCKISESGYKTARRKLQEMGWITCVAGKSIIVNYDVIYGGKGVSENTSIKKGITENTSLGVSEKSSLGISENTYNNISNNIIEYDNSGAAAGAPPCPQQEVGAIEFTIEPPKVEMAPRQEKKQLMGFRF